jgi:quinol monooxygenase YgiN
VPITYAITFDVKPAKRDEFLALLMGVLDAMRSEANFHEARLHRDPASANRFYLYETWESHADVLEVQLKRRYREAWHAALPELLEQPRGISVWEPVWAAQGPARASTR